MPKGIYLRKFSTLEARFLNQVDQNGPVPEHCPSLGRCWIWKGSIRPNGYAQFSKGTGMPIPQLAHRVSWKLFRSEIGISLTIDHLCRNRSCTNPVHLEMVPIKVNILRGTSPSAFNATKSHCLNGHSLSGSNLYVVKTKSGTGRQCMECRKLRLRVYRKEAKRNASLLARER